MLLQTVFVSSLPRSSRTSSPGKLIEISSSDTNSRTYNMLPPPLPKGLKRKTLVERAEEDLRPAPPQPSSLQINSRTANAPIKGPKTASLSRQASFSSSTSSKPPLPSVRHASSSSFSSSMGSGIRPPSAQSYRAQTAPTGRLPRKFPSNQTRPTSSIDTHQMNFREMQMNEDSKSITPFSLNFQQHQSHIPPIKTSKRSYDNQMNLNSEWSSYTNITRSIRDFSISTAFSGLILEQTNPTTLAVVDEGEFSGSPTHIPTRIRTPVISLPPRTPSPSKSRKKTLNSAFLTRDSNTKAIVWDQDARIEKMENMYSQISATINSTTAESSTLKETISVYKARSMYKDRMLEDH